MDQLITIYFVSRQCADLLNHSGIIPIVLTPYDTWVSAPSAPSVTQQVPPSDWITSYQNRHAAPHGSSWVHRAPSTCLIFSPANTDRSTLGTLPWWYSEPAPISASVPVLCCACIRRRARTNTLQHHNVHSRRVNAAMHVVSHALGVLSANGEVAERRLSFNTARTATTRFGTMRAAWLPTDVPAADCLAWNQFIRTTLTRFLSHSHAPDLRLRGYYLFTETANFIFIKNVLKHLVDSEN